MTRKIAEELEVSPAMFAKVKASYSADMISHHRRPTVRRPFEFRGDRYVSTGGTSYGYGQRSDTEAYRLLPLADFPEEASFYAQNRPGFEGDWAENRRRQPEGFYHGMKVNRGKSALWVLVGPPIRFVLAEDLDDLHAVDQEAGEPEAGLQIDFDGRAVPVRPSGNGKPVQMSFDDLVKLEAWHKA